MNVSPLYPRTSSNTPAPNTAVDIENQNRQLLTHLIKGQLQNQASTAYQPATPTASTAPHLLGFLPFPRPQIPAFNLTAGNISFETLVKQFSPVIGQSPEMPNFINEASQIIAEKFIAKGFTSEQLSKICQSKISLQELLHLSKVINNISCYESNYESEMAEQLGNQDIFAHGLNDAGVEKLKTIVNSGIFKILKDAKFSIKNITSLCQSYHCETLDKLTNIIKNDLNFFNAMIEREISADNIINLCQGMYNSHDHLNHIKKHIASGAFDMMLNKGLSSKQIFAVSYWENTNQFENLEALIQNGWFDAFIAHGISIEQILPLCYESTSEKRTKLQEIIHNGLFQKLKDINMSVDEIIKLCHPTQLNQLNDLEEHTQNPIILNLLQNGFTVDESAAFLKLFSTEDFNKITKKISANVLHVLFKKGFTKANFLKLARCLPKTVECLTDLINSRRFEGFYQKLKDCFFASEKIHNDILVDYHTLTNMLELFNHDVLHRIAAYYGTSDILEWSQWPHHRAKFNEIFEYAKANKKVLDSLNAQRRSGV